ncbi:MAG: tripartite tricarboxylate transporter substrate binding protein [Betaproteobacteria bacterium]|nr:tripartite tricarboxylate transporter substrate binding protein [Betaproteobacteria bacterium]
MKRWPKLFTNFRRHGATGDGKICKHAVAAGLALAAALVTLPALAQSFPSKAIRLVSPFPPGGSVDLVGRLLAAKLSETLGQQMVVDNRSGASGVIGTEMVMNSPADGYTLLINTIPFVSNQFLMPRVPYDPLRDFVAISLAASAPSFVTVHPSVPARSIQELIALAKAKPGALNYAAAGVGTNPHIAGELFNLLAEVDIVAVQFKGGGPADMAVIAGEVGITFGNVSQQIGHVKGGRMRALAVTSAKRNSVMPELPTVAEAAPEGPLRGYEFDTWFVVAAPKGTPRSIVDTLNSHIRKVLTTPDQVKFYQERGLTVIASTPEEAAAYLESEQRKWGRVIRERGIKAQ